MTEYSNNLPNEQNTTQINNATVGSVPQSGGFNPFSAFFKKSEHDPNQEVLNAIPETSTKFFNQLEDEPATFNNMSAFSPVESFTVNDTAREQVTPESSANVEIFDMPSNEIKSTPAISEVESLEEPASTIDDLNPNNKFFQPASSSIDVIDTPIEPQSINQSLNPMDFVSNLTQDDQAAKNASTSLSNAINQIRDLVTKLNNEGLNVKLDEADLDSNYQINITIIK